MKFIMITIALVAAPLFAASGEAGHILAMDQKTGVVHSRDSRTDERYSERDLKNNKSGADLSTKNDVQNRKKSPPEKKPRLKYRDEPKCSC